MYNHRFDETILTEPDTWVSASSTYNYMMKDPLLDWLKHHHKSLKNKTYRSTVSESLQISKYNFTNYIMEQGNIFERKVMKMITKKFGKERVIDIHGEEGPRTLEKVDETFEAMKQGIPIIHSGVLHNPINQTFGIPDLIVRSDWLKYLVDESPISSSLEHISAKDIGQPWHYRIIDIKFTCLNLRSDGVHLLNSNSFPAYKAQLLIYNWALGLLQGYKPSQVYILGRRWKYSSKGEVFSGEGCFDRLATIDYHTVDRDYIELTRQAIAWVKEVRTDKAAKWNITKYPLKRWELYPNMCNNHDHPWRPVKEKIAEKSKELTNLWMVGPKNRKVALNNKICNWGDKNCNSENMGISEGKISRTLDAIIEINQQKKIIMFPEYIKNNIGNWKNQDKIEFFVDFETCNGAVSSIKNLPIARNEMIIFMIGVGYIDPENGDWIYKDFTVNKLSFNEEKRICKEFSSFITAMAVRWEVETPKCYHWARAEDTFWDGASDRHDPNEDWKSWDWVDLLQVFKEEPITINGCLSYGLKKVAGAMHKHKLIDSSWNKKSNCVDGLSAMIVAREAHNQAKRRNIKMSEIKVIKDIIRYNEVDVKVLYEILDYLRKNKIKRGKRPRIVVPEEVTISDTICNLKRKRINRKEY